MFNRIKDRILSTAKAVLAGVEVIGVWLRRYWVLTALIILITPIPANVNFVIAGVLS